MEKDHTKSKKEKNAEKYINGWHNRRYWNTFRQWPAIVAAGVVVFRGLLDLVPGPALIDRLRLRQIEMESSWHNPVVPRNNWKVLGDEGNKG
ncbi:hypothetical protein RHMOL_Rhmol09G0026400 [Rhododendron molle]|uniref:Uncharacterized protein n=1 Tax=Rhododendron molle TaxID=49168 RepID=A0ACC0MAF3_RHOML|nr:hypothetical protein RHMOL_Rhmol09G0026400 [Rhododendron molle]